MRSPGMGAQCRSNGGRRLAVWAAVAMSWVPLTTGCQVEYAGMTLPSGKYMHDDVQYFAPGPHFPWANTQAATQRARMQAMGIDVPAPGQGGPLTPPPAAGTLPPVQNQLGRPTDVNASPLSEVAPLPPGPGAGAAPPPGPGVTPPPPNAVPPPGPGGAAPPPGPGGAVPPPGE
jgi:hypothetical protein